MDENDDVASARDCPSLPDDYDAPEVAGDC